MAYYENKRDSKERIEFVKFWANYMKEAKNEDWSSQQAVLINSVLESANEDPDLYIKVKKIFALKKFGVTGAGRL